MSSIWTPGGEVPVPDDGDDAWDEGDDVDPEVAEEMQRSFAEARERLLEVPAEVVVSNHVMGLYELGALHLTTQPPNLQAAALAIDAVGLLVENLEGRLAEEETLKDAVGQLRMAFVQIANTAQGGEGPAEAT